MSTASFAWAMACHAAYLAADMPIVQLAGWSSRYYGPTGGGGGFTPPGSIIYNDDFSGFTTGTSPSGTVMNWSPNVNDSVTPHSAVTISTDYTPPGGGKCIKFFYSSAGMSGPCPLYLCELDFDVGAYYSELTLQYYVRIPDNYVHYASGSSNNNKFYRLGPHNPASGGRERLGASYERQNDSSSSLGVEWDTSLPPAGEDFTAHAPDCPDFVTSADRGQWLKIMIYNAAPTARTTGPAIQQIWRNDVLISNRSPDIYDSTLPQHGNRYGYLQGAMNGYGDGATSFYYANMTVWANGVL